MRMLFPGRPTATVVAASLLVLLPFTAPVTAQGQGAGVKQRLTTLEREDRVENRGKHPRGGVEQRLTALENQVAALEQLTQSTFNVSVNCGNGETIGDALAQTQAHTGVVVITVSGVCTENVNVTRGQTVIRSGSSDAQIIAADHARPVIQLTNVSGGSRFLSLMGPLTISGGMSGVMADFGTQVQLSGVVVTSNSSTGIWADHRSIVRLMDNTVVENNGMGVNAQNGAEVSVWGGAIRGNNDYGLQLGSGAVADVSGGTEITLNRGGAAGAHSIRGAVGLYAGSVLRLGNASVSDNTGNGLFVAIGSVVWLEGGTIINGNGGHGISLSDGGIVGKFFVVTNIQINNNGAWGISCSASPGTAHLYGFPPTAQPITTTGNTLGGINCPVSPVP